jgi:flagellar basal-body rod protein FlgB
VTESADLSLSSIGTHHLKIASPSVDTVGMDATPSLSDMLPHLVEATNLRHRVLAMNIANVNTPGFQRLDVDFEGSLERQMRYGSEAANGVKPRVVEGGGGVPRADGNNVDIDREMGRLTKNALLHALYSQLQSGNMARMRSAIIGR